MSRVYSFGYGGLVTEITKQRTPPVLSLKSRRGSGFSKAQFGNSVITIKSGPKTPKLGIDSN